jgi:hypothetical protein
MSAAYNELLDATIQHLEDLKSRGVRAYRRFKSS